ncbi:hypothetical protein M197_gp27 [Haloarcula hispanica tailed virus 2]|uniref:Uncharacterized protein n=1 Tax=Haloarcula hispanica tailed virus 2 TaxID=1273751 RepID=R4TKJ1_9CAUD|nr:hypothetical protein M197_gp27 [Haloarcula hispanica tailed virus 2]AGM11192.1 hypothetical protein HHTV2_27 [Haloarcula hispanica tailed virus 2]
MPRCRCGHECLDGAHLLDHIRDAHPTWPGADEPRYDPLGRGPWV